MLKRNSVKFNTDENRVSRKVVRISVYNQTHQCSSEIRIGAQILLDAMRSLLADINDNVDIAPMTFDFIFPC